MFFSSFKQPINQQHYLLNNASYMMRNKYTSHKDFTGLFRFIDKPVGQRTHKHYDSLQFSESLLPIFGKLLLCFSFGEFMLNTSMTLVEPKSPFANLNAFRLQETCRNKRAERLFIKQCIFTP